MELNRKNAIILGGVLIAALISGVFSSVPALEQLDYLRKLASIESEVFAAIIFQALMAILYVGIIVITYPIVKLDNQTGAHAYLIFRAIGAAFLFVGIVTLLLLLATSRKFVVMNDSNAVNLETTGELFRMARDWLNHIGMVLPWTIGGFFLYRAFFKTKLIPQWLSMWGLIATAMTLLATILYMLDRIQIVTVTYFALNIPTALFELVLAVYLIIKGFRPASLPVPQNESN